MQVAKTLLQCVNPPSMLPFPAGPGPASSLNAAKSPPFKSHQFRPEALVRHDPAGQPWISYCISLSLFSYLDCSIAVDFYVVNEVTWSLTPGIYRRCSTNVPSLSSSYQVLLYGSLSNKASSTEPQIQRKLFERLLSQFLPRMANS